LAEPLGENEILLSTKEWTPGSQYIAPGRYKFRIKDKPAPSHKKNPENGNVRVTYVCEVIDTMPGARDMMGRRINHSGNATGKGVGFLIEFLQAVDPATYGKITPDKTLRLNLVRDIGKEFAATVEDNEYEDKKTGEMKRNSKLTYLYPVETFNKWRAEFTQEQQAFKAAAISAPDASEEDVELDDDPELE